MIQNIEGISPDLESHPFVQLDVLGQGHVQLAEEWAIDRTSSQSSKLARAIIKEYLSGEGRLTKRRGAATIRINHGWVYVVDIPILSKDPDQVADLIVCKRAQCGLIG